MNNAAQPKGMKELGLVKFLFPANDNLSNIKDVVISRDGVKIADIEDALRSINRRFDRIPLKNLTLDLFSNNRIHLLNNMETIKVPSAFPVWKIKNANGQAEAFVNITPYVGTMTVDKLDIRRLFGLMLFGSVSIAVYEKWDKIHSSIVLAEKGSSVYARIMHKVVDRITGVGMDRLRSDQIKYVFAKYFMCSMLRRTLSQDTDVLALKATSGSSALGALSQLEISMSEYAKVTSQTELYSKDILEFLDILINSSSWMSKMNVRGFIQTYTGMYGNISLLMMEDIFTFLAGLASHQVGAELVSSYTFDPVYGKEGDAVVDALASIIR